MAPPTSTFENAEEGAAVTLAQIVVETVVPIVQAALVETVMPEQTAMPEQTEMPE